MNIIRKSFSLIFSLLCIFVLVACIPQRYAPPPPPPPPPDIAITLTAQAVQLGYFTQTAQAIAQQPIIIVVTATPEPVQATATTDPAANVAPPATNTVTLTVSRNTNCRQGPGQGFDEVSALGPGQVAEVIGKDTFDNYWIIKVPDGSGKTCWLWGQYASVTGDTSTIASVATPTSSAANSSGASANGAPNAPVITNTSLNCVDVGGGDFKYEVGIDWADNSNNETKFNIYTSTSQKFTAAADKKHYELEETLPSGSDFFVTIKAANDKGESAPDQAGFECP